jgi:hypothetical protein
MKTRTLLVVRRCWRTTNPRRGEPVATEDVWGGGCEAVTAVTVSVVSPETVSVVAALAVTAPVVAELAVAASVVAVLVVTGPDVSVLAVTASVVAVLAVIGPVVTAVAVLATEAEMELEELGEGVGALDVAMAPVVSVGPVVSVAPVVSVGPAEEEEEEYEKDETELDARVAGEGVGIPEVVMGPVVIDASVAGELR